LWPLSLFLRVMATRDLRFWVGQDKPAFPASGNASGRKRARVDDADRGAVLDGGSGSWPCYRCETDKRQWTLYEVQHMNEQANGANLEPTNTLHAKRNALSHLGATFV